MILSLRYDGGGDVTYGGYFVCAYTYHMNTVQLLYYLIKSKMKPSTSNCVFFAASMAVWKGY